MLDQHPCRFICWRCPPFDTLSDEERPWSALRGRGGGSDCWWVSEPRWRRRRTSLPPRIELKENYPNPFFPTTTIPFVISQEVCARGHQPVVSLKIYNVLVQVVAIPVLTSGGGPRLAGERLDSLRLRCGEYHAFWDGKYLDGRRRGDTGSLLLPAHGRRRAVHPEDDRPEEGDQSAVRGAARVGRPFRAFGWDWWSCDCQCGRNSRVRRLLTLEPHSHRRPDPSLRSG